MGALGTAIVSGIWAGGSPTGVVSDLLVYQQKVAAADAVWASGAAAAKQAFEQLLSTAYVSLADDEYGLLGAVTKQIGETADAAKDQTDGLAGADKALSIGSIENLADFTVDVQTAASKAAKTGVVAETQYDLARAEAKRDYLSTVSMAAKTLAEKEADANLAYTLASPLWWYEWDPEAEAAAALIRDNALAAAQAEYDATVKAARVTMPTTSVCPFLGEMIEPLLRDMKASPYQWRHRPHVAIKLIDSVCQSA